MSDKFEMSKNVETSIKILRTMIDDDDEMGNLAFEIDKKGNIIAVNYQKEQYYIIYGHSMMDIMAFLNVWNDEDLAELWIGSMSITNDIFELGLFTSQYKRIAHIIVTNNEKYGIQYCPRYC